MRNLSARIRELICAKQICNRCPCSKVTPTKLIPHRWRTPRNARNWATGASFRDQTQCECLLGHLHGAVPSALSSLDLNPHKQTPGHLSPRSPRSALKGRHRPRHLRPQRAPRMPTPEKAPNPNFPGPQRRSPPAYAPAAARPAPKAAPLRSAAARDSPDFCPCVI